MKHLETIRAHPARFAVPAVLLLVLAVIVSISPRLSSVEAGKCVASDGVLGTFDRIEPPRPVAAIPFSDGEGRRRGLDDFPGAVVLNFWATWCGPCVREMPQLDRLKKHLAEDGIAVLALSEDRDGAAVVKKFYRLNGIENLDVLIDGGGKVLRGSNIVGLPTTLLIDAQKREVGRVTGVAEWDSGDAIQFLRRCLGP